MEIKKNITKNTNAAFSRYEILKALEPVNVDEKCYSVHQFILPLANSHWNFHILFRYNALYFSMCIFTLYF